VRAAGITQAQLALKTGWSEQRVYRVLNGKTDLTAEDMETIAHIIEKPVAALYRDVERKAS
jgi:transcriptional regulator with XRE-family HTH domain